MEEVILAHPGIMQRAENLAYMLSYLSSSESALFIARLVTQLLQVGSRRRKARSCVSCDPLLVVVAYRDSDRTISAVARLRG